MTRFGECYVRGRSLHERDVSSGAHIWAGITMIVAMGMLMIQIDKGTGALSFTTGGSSLTTQVAHLLAR